MEGDHGGASKMREVLNFYPRPHMEGDWPTTRRTIGLRISTHALTWRATPRMPSITTLFRWISTHALTWRATLYATHISSLTVQFLPTPSHGGRHKQSDRAINVLVFLPTPSHGGRPVAMALDLDWGISTHALTWRATVAFLRHLYLSRFLPTPSHGGRQQTC